ncbi:hypothetical protein PsW64_00517 [Pseudovibrio sp. W64]|uniref:hypothetical protein n=1 Tax=unclassified Pseudovibrio TaxID=2627060 RepID=UPI00070DB181|nr:MULTISPECIES: hypothetical protein [unclassified Pseudovibrio]KZK89889.1 hypothetical protein PsW64_00517 [Pseudovibrio sp. W64]KZK97507.1 hypothetical protein PsW74_03641 [Pseudovibrio sp. W74]KZL04788.1 hypothetical protein PsAD14_05027 [Pseudovibrio sp. Ad14]
MRSNLKTLLFGVTGAIAIATLPAIAQANPINARITTAFGALEGKMLGLLSGTAAFGQGPGFASQFDATAGGTKDYGFYAGTGRMGFRTQDYNYFGVVGSAAQINGGAGSFGYVGAEAQVHFENLSVDGLIGVQMIDDTGSVMGGATASYYASENARFYAGYRYLRDSHIYAMGMEFKPGTETANGMTMFADLRSEKLENASIMAGVRFSFADAQTLVEESRGTFVNNSYILDALLPD